MSLAICSDWLYFCLLVLDVIFIIPVSTQLCWPFAFKNIDLNLKGLSGFSARSCSLMVSCFSHLLRGQVWEIMKHSQPRWLPCLWKTNKMTQFGFLEVVKDKRRQKSESIMVPSVSCESVRVSLQLALNLKLAWLWTLAFISNSPKSLLSRYWEEILFLTLRCRH